jgi:hypothetical protein
MGWLVGKGGPGRAARERGAAGGTHAETAGRGLVADFSGFNRRPTSRRCRPTCKLKISTKLNPKLGILGQPWRCSARRMLAAPHIHHQRHDARTSGSLMMTSTALPSCISEYRRTPQPSSKARRTHVGLVDDDIDSFTIMHQ